MKINITKAIVWIIYALFVGVLIYGAILRTNAVSAERGVGGNEGRFGSGDGGRYYDREVSQLHDKRGYIPYKDDHQPRRGQGDGWMHGPDHGFGQPFGEYNQYGGQPSWGQGDGWMHGPDHGFGQPFGEYHQYGGQPRDDRGSGRWFYPSTDEELNDYAERYLDIDDLLEKAGEK